MKNADVVIVEAGSASLSAAKVPGTTGRNLKLLEAAGRGGGARLPGKEWRGSSPPSSTAGYSCGKLVGFGNNS